MDVATNVSLFKEPEVSYSNRTLNRTHMERVCCTLHHRWHDNHNHTGVIQRAVEGKMRKELFYYVVILHIYLISFKIIV